MEATEIPVLELKVNPVKGKTLGVFAGRDEDELLWIAGCYSNGCGTQAAEC